MSVIELGTLKKHLRVTHDAFDDDLQRRLNGAEDWARKFLNRDDLPFEDENTVSEESETSSTPSGDTIAPSVVDGVLLYVQAHYDPLEPPQRASILRAAEDSLHPYRLRLGV